MLAYFHEKRKHTSTPSKALMGARATGLREHDVMEVNKFKGVSLMKIFLTGASGYLGKHVAEDFFRRGHELVLMSRKKPKLAAIYTWIEGDCNDLKTCVDATQNKNIDAVVHIAAAPTPTDTVGSATYENLDIIPTTMQTNVMGLYNMLQAALRAGVKTFVQTGSNCVFGHVFRISPHAPAIKYLPIDEHHPCDPEDSYSVSKACGELMLKAYSAYGMNTYALRSGWIINEEMRQRHAGSVTAATSIESVFNAFIALEDCANAHVLLTEAAYSGGLPNHACYYLNADDSLALEPTRELIQKFCPHLFDALKTNMEGHASFFSNDSLKSAIGWTPHVTWRKH